MGFDTAKVSRFRPRLMETPTVLSCLVVRHDTLVYEYYNGGIGMYGDYEIASVTKSILSAAVGAAVRDSLIGSINDKMVSFFPDHAAAVTDTLKPRITIEHLLMMRGGFDYREGDDRLNLFTPTSNWVHGALSMPMRAEPGTRYNYLTYATHPLSAIITRRSGMSTFDYTDRMICRPIGMSIRSWATDPQGINVGGAGITCTPRDLARFGALYLHNGRIDGKQVLPAAWVQQTFTAHDTLSESWGDFRNIRYGYLWWIADAGSRRVEFAQGYAGQSIFLVRSLDLIVVATSSFPLFLSDADPQERAVVGLLVNTIIPSIIVP